MLKIFGLIAFLASGSAALAMDVVREPLPQQTLDPGRDIDKVVSCKEGMTVLSGGYEIGNDRLALTASASHPWTGNHNGGAWTGWRVVITNRGTVAAPANITLYAVCQ